MSYVENGLDSTRFDAVTAGRVVRVMGRVPEILRIASRQDDRTDFGTGVRTTLLDESCKSRWPVDVGLLRTIILEPNTSTNTGLFVSPFRIPHRAVTEPPELARHIKNQ